MMAERGIAITHTTILRWVQRYVPEFEKCWSRYARPVGDSWRVDETDIKIKGQWVYLYRVVDKQGRTVDFLLSKRRDMAVAKRFFSLVVRNKGSPPGDHLGRVRRLASGGRQIESGRNLAAARADTLLQVLE